jgi:hypothetical protein
VATELEEIQIYLSYAPDDDGVPPGAPSTSGFVTALAGYLEYAFQFHGYPRPSIWRAEREEEEATDLDSNTREAIDASSLMLILFSRNWVHRLRCRKELEYFINRWRGDGESLRQRIFVAHKNYVEKKEYPALFATESIPRDTGFDFFKFDGQLEPGNERLYFDPQRQSQTSEYAQIASELGRSLWLRARNCLRTDRRRVVTSATPLVQQASPGGYTIYLAKPGPDMLKEYRRIARELCERGFSIIPREDQEIPTDQSAPTFIDEALKGANISVHLIGADYGYAPTNSDRIVGLQLARAAARMGGQNKSFDKFHRIIWAPRFVADLEFHDRLDNLAPFRLDGDKVIESDNLSDFDDFLRNHIRPAPRQDNLRAASVMSLPEEKPGEKKVYVYHCEEDSQLAADLAVALQELHLHIEPILPALQGPPREIERFHRERLIECDAVVLCWANASEVWVRAHSNQLKDWRALGRAERFDFRGLIAWPPPGDRKKILLRVPPRAEIDKVLDLTEHVPPASDKLNDWFLAPPPNN